MMREYRFSDMAKPQRLFALSIVAAAFKPMLIGAGCLAPACLVFIATWNIGVFSAEFFYYPASWTGAIAWSIFSVSLIYLNYKVLWRPKPEVDLDPAFAQHDLVLSNHLDSLALEGRPKTWRLETGNRALSQVPDPQPNRSSPCNFQPFHSALTHRGRVTKRAFDLALAIPLLVLVLPVLIGAALAVRFETRGAVFFSQLRFGRGNSLVRVWKLRTMYVHLGDRSGAQHTEARDPRVTRVGRILRRTSIDELPQLLNVLRGEMSLVGPRPHASQMKVAGEYYYDAVDAYALRHVVKPGITGWAQINGSRGAVTTLNQARRRVDLDLWYIDNWSIRLDLWILVRTAIGGFISFRAD
ncbi:sugar transferase [Falsiroseomonas sp. HC035]|uniref:sugar transferase n=1 Tax=Falsiroseomonas sp. HC035 TaxID=3390999 RepID=UPI003D32415C